MAISSTARNKLIDEINGAFGNIGKQIKLETKNNRAPIAWEYFVASHLYTIAGARKRIAEKWVLRAGIILDKETNPQPAGTDTHLYSDETVYVRLKVGQPTIKIDHDVFVGELLRLGVSQELITQATAKAEYEQRPPHKFTADIKVA